MTLLPPRVLGMLRACGMIGLAALALASMTECAAAQTTPRIETNQSYVDTVMQATSLAVSDPMAVFALVFESLPPRVNVYPTENYYYFTFYHNGVPYAGNIRLDASTRDQGKVEFDCFEAESPWRRGTPESFLQLDSSKGVSVERVEPLLYRISFQNKSVLFALNDLSQVRPPASAIGPDERFIGPVFDESAVRFFLIYNSRLKVFHFVLDETAPVADGFVPLKATDRIIVGKRTGFAFYRDQKLDRKILIAVFAANSDSNNYFDGPFDQLPDNFIEGETLRDAILDMDPSVRGKIDRLGHYVGEAERYAVHPYRLFAKEADLLVVHRCATRVAASIYHACFSFDDESLNSANPQPAALTRKWNLKSGSPRMSGRKSP